MSNHSDDALILISEEQKNAEIRRLSSFTKVDDIKKKIKEMVESITTLNNYLKDLDENQISRVRPTVVNFFSQVNSNPHTILDIETYLHQNTDMNTNKEKADITIRKMDAMIQLYTAITNEVKRILNTDSTRPTSRGGNRFSNKKQKSNKKSKKRSSKKRKRSSKKNYFSL